jgi:hypothetical protein
MPVNSLRILVLHPPYLGQVGGQEVGAWVAQKYGLVSITLEGSVRGRVESWVRAQGSFTPDIQHSIVYTRCNSTESKMKGWALAGWPRSIGHSYFLTDIATAPHLVLLLDEADETVLQLYRQLPEGSPHFHLQPKPPAKQYEQELKAFRALKDWVQDKMADRVHHVSLAEGTLANLARLVDMQVMNPKVYS